MSKICPKCNYVRKDSDEAPDWQCPSCGVAYHKVGTNGGADLARYRQQQRQLSEPSNKNQWLWLIGLVLVCAICVQSYLSYKKKHTQRAVETVAAIEHTEVKKSTKGQPKVILYGTEWCGYCAASRDYFKAHGITYEDLDIEKNQQAYLEYQKLGGQGVPLLQVGDEVIKGYSEERMHLLLANYHRY